MILLALELQAVPAHVASSSSQENLEDSHWEIVSK